MIKIVSCFWNVEDYILKNKIRGERLRQFSKQNGFGTYYLFTIDKIIMDYKLYVSKKLKVIDYINKKAVVVPTNIIQQDGQGNQFVFVVNNATVKTGVAKKVTVKVGQSADNVTEILEGITTNDVIVTEGFSTLIEGTKLNF